MYPDLPRDMRPVCLVSVEVGITNQCDTLSAEDCVREILGGGGKAINSLKFPCPYSCFLCDSCAAHGRPQRSLSESIGHSGCCSRDPSNPNNISPSRGPETRLLVGCDPCSAMMIPWNMCGQGRVDLHPFIRIAAMFWNLDLERREGHLFQVWIPLAFPQLSANNRKRRSHRFYFHFSTGTPN